MRIMKVSIVGIVGVMLTCIILVAGDGLSSMYQIVEGQIENFAVDHDGGRIFVGGEDVIFVLAMHDMRCEKKIITGPLEDSVYCPPDPGVQCSCPIPDQTNPECEKYKRTNQSNVNKALVLDTAHNKLISCSNLYHGFCQKISLETLEITESVYKAVAGPGEDHRSVMFVVPEVNPQGVLYVAVSSIMQPSTSHTPRIPMLSTRDLQTLDYVKPASLVDMARIQNFNFIDGISYRGFNYFLFVVEKDTGPISKLARVCQQDTSYRSYVDMQILCDNKHVATDAFLGRMGSKLADLLQVEGDDDSLYVTYQNGDSSALCAYTLAHINAAFSVTVQNCFNGDGILGPEHITSLQPLCRKTSYNITGSYCGEHSENGFIQGEMSITSQVNTGSLDGVRVTSAVVKAYAKQTIAYLGTDSGVLQEVVLEGPREWHTVTDMTLNSGGQEVKDMILSGNEEDIIILSNSMVEKVHTSPDNCYQYNSCASCSDSDPHCAWCLHSKVCMMYEDCMASDSSAVIGYHEECPMVKSVTPRSLSLSSLKRGNSFILELNMAVEALESVDCLLTTSTSEWLIEDAEVTGTEVMCPSLAGYLMTVPGNTEHLVTNLTIASELDFIPALVTIYDCTKLASCTACTQAEYPGNRVPIAPCAWCPSTHQCIEKTSAAPCPATPPGGIAENSGDGDKLSDLNSFIPVEKSNTRVRRAVENTIVDSTMCPHVALPVPMHLRAHSGKLLPVITVTVDNLLAYQKPLKCQYEIPDGLPVTKDATLLNGDKSVKCDPTVLNYSGSEAMIDVPLSVVWDENKQLDSPDPITVEVYQCKKLAMSCGQCSTLDYAYRCVWCDSQCVYQDQCQTDIVASNETCPNPQIAKFSPVTGPVWGGTTLTIDGVNLGKYVSDVQTSVDGVPCLAVEQLYQPATRFVCITGASSEARFGLVEITVGGKYNATSNKQFEYLNAEVSSFQPDQGPLSGGTLVTLKGRNLNLGTNVTILIGDRKAVLLKRNASHLLLETPEFEQKSAAPLDVTLDGNSITDGKQDMAFTYLDDPVINDVSPLEVFVIGGTMLEVRGIHLDSVKQPQLMIYMDTGSVETDCENVTSERMLCPIPNLSHPNLTFDPVLHLDYGVILDGVTVTQRLTDDPHFAPLVVYPRPQINPFEEVVKYKEGMHLAITGERLDVVPGMVVTVGASQCPLVFINATLALCNPPAEPGKLGDNNRALVIVRLGYYQDEPGFMSYAAEPMDHISLGIILGIIIGICLVILGILLFCLICWCKYRHGKNSNRDSVFLPDTHRVVDIEMDAINPRQTPRPQISPPVAAVSTGSYRDPTAKPHEMAPLTAPESHSLTGDETFASQAVTAGGDERDEEVVDGGQGKEFELAELLDKLDNERLKEDVQAVYIPRSRLEMGDMIGKGHFGCVYSATLRDENMTNPVKVAVKTVQGSNLNQLALESFLKEGVIMNNFTHPHVLNLLGVCIDNKNPMVILPYMAGGDLRSFIKDKKKNFTARQLLQLAQQVAEGMAYLSSLNFVHRDLAARNCMIDDMGTVKVADFGLSRDTYERDCFHSKDKKGKLPIKWMALESLQNLVFTSKSDVWSFGILLWELMTRGVSPYPDVDAFDVRDYLAQGRRLYQPKYCPDNVYKIMLACWVENPNRRPTFIDLVNTIELMLNPPPKQDLPDETEEEPMYMNVTRPESGEYHLDGVPTTMAAPSGVADNPPPPPPMRPVPSPTVLKPHRRVPTVPT